MARNEMIFDTYEQLVGFWGSESQSSIYSVGVITLQSNCWPIDIERPASGSSPTRKPLEIGVGEIVVLVLVVCLVVLSIPACYCAYKCLKGGQNSSTVIPDTGRS